MHCFSIQFVSVDEILLTSLNWGGGGGGGGNNKHIVIGHVCFISIPFNISLKIIWWEER